MDKQGGLTMNREQAKELLPIIQAFAEGKTILVQEDIDWCYLGDDADFNLNPLRYRIKPKPKYRPFKDAEECWQEMQKHQPFGWIKDGPRMCNVISIREDGIIAYTNVDNSWYDFKRSFKLKFTDGTPFGIKE